MAPSAACECGSEEQIVDHVVLQCPIYRPPRGLHGLNVLDDETIVMAAEHLLRSGAAKQRIGPTRSNDGEGLDCALLW